MWAVAAVLSGTPSSPTLSVAPVTTSLAVTTPLLYTPLASTIAALLLLVLAILVCTADTYDMYTGHIYSGGVCLCATNVRGQTPIVGLRCKHMSHGPYNGPCRSSPNYTFSLLCTIALLFSLTRPLWNTTRLCLDSLHSTRDIRSCSFFHLRS